MLTAVFMSTRSYGPQLVMFMGDGGNCREGGDGE